MRFIGIIAEVRKDLTHLHSYHVHQYEMDNVFFARPFRIYVFYTNMCLSLMICHLYRFNISILIQYLFLGDVYLMFKTCILFE